MRCAIVPFAKAQEIFSFSFIFPLQEIKTISNGACSEKWACAYMAYYKGIVGDVTSSCIGPYSCEYAAAVHGQIGDITESSCQGASGPDGYVSACDSAAFFYGIIGDIVSSCHGPYSCENAAYYHGEIGNITESSCLGQSACELAASCYDAGCGSFISEIKASCDGQFSCYKFAYDGGHVGGIRFACNAESACKGAAQGPGNFTNGIESCCNAQEDCKEVQVFPPQCDASGTPPPTPPGTPPPTPPGTPPPTPAPGPMPTPGPTRTPAPTKYHTDLPTTSGVSFCR